MSYHIDGKTVGLAALRERIEETDLVPSRAPLLSGIAAKFASIENQGITDLAALRDALKNTRRIEALSGTTGIDKQYLVLLRREIESYFPGPFPLKSFDIIPVASIARLESLGIKNTADLYEAVYTEQERQDLAATSDIDTLSLDEIFCLADLTRVQWVSPNAAAMILAAGCRSSAALASAEPEQLCRDLERINEGGKYFKGNIGLRDVKRLVKAAGYLPG